MKGVAIKSLFFLILINFIYSQNTIVAVFDFENNGLMDSQVRQIASRLESELEKTGLKIVERKQINDLLEEQKLQMSGLIDDDALRLGDILGATHILIGSVGKMTETYYTITATYNLGLFYEINNNLQLAENFYNDCYKMSGKSEYLDARVRVKKRKSEVQLLKEQTGVND